MKIEYNSIIGYKDPDDSLFCHSCCFNDTCLPYNVYNCYNAVFTRTESDIFKI